jgi:beta-glucosidase
MDEFEMKAGESYRFSMTLTFDSGWPRDQLDKYAYLNWTDVSRDLKAEALTAAEDADVILFFGGIDANLEGEEMPIEIDGFLGGDRINLNLPKPQEDILKALKATEKPIVFVNFSGSAIALNWEDQNLDAIVQAFYPGEKAGTAIADLLWGDFSPSGRLPVTFYKSLDDQPAFGDYSMENRTYKYYSGDPLYPFGYGLSYTSFAYSDLNVEQAADATQPLTVSATVSNTGKMPGREVVQVYLQPQTRPNRSVPRVELGAFDVIELESGESKSVTLSVPPGQLGYYDDEGAFVPANGNDIIISIGGGQPGTTETLSKTVSFQAAN